MWKGVAAWQEAGGAFRHIGMLGLERELGTSGYTEPSVSVVWAMRPFCQVLVPLQCFFQFLDNKPMFMWDLTSREVNTSTEESQVTLLSILDVCSCLQGCFYLCCPLGVMPARWELP